MSGGYDFSYILESRRRKEIYNNRVRETTEGFYRRYRDRYDRMAAMGYDKYAPREMERLLSDINRIDYKLDSNPTLARKISYEVGSYINTVENIARKAMYEFQRAEEIKREAERAKAIKHKNELERIYYDKVASISPDVVHFAKEDLAVLRKQFESDNKTSIELLSSKIDDIIAASQQKAEEWKNKEAKSFEKEAVKARIEETEELVSKQNIEDEKVKNDFLSRINKLKESLHNNSQDLSKIENEIEAITEDVDENCITEEVRKQTVIAVVKQLKKQGFIVSPPTITLDGKGVKIVASKPSGKRATCEIGLDGKLAYRFDKYVGKTCLKDIETFNIDLDRIYSVKLSDKRVIWENPDRLDKDGYRAVADRHREK